MKKQILYFLSSAAFVALSSCQTTRQADDSTPIATTVTIDKPLSVTGWNSTKTFPKAVIYKTNGDFAENVPVVLSADRKTIISFPAPSDIKNLRPVRLASGFLLDTKGVSPNTAFTRYTYSEYAALPKAPDISRLRNAIIPGAMVTEIVELPYRVGEATAQECDSLINSGLPGCKTVYKIDAVMVGPENI